MQRAYSRVMCSSKSMASGSRTQIISSVLLPRICLERPSSWQRSARANNGLLPLLSPSVPLTSMSLRTIAWAPCHRPRLVELNSRRRLGNDHLGNAAIEVAPLATAQASRPSHSSLAQPSRARRNRHNSGLGTYSAITGLRRPHLRGCRWHRPRVALSEVTASAVLVRCEAGVNYGLHRLKLCWSPWTPLGEQHSTARTSSPAGAVHEEWWCIRSTARVAIEDHRSADRRTRDGNIRPPRFGHHLEPERLPPPVAYGHSSRSE
jgi:hypothetical protein